ncbi:GNAT family N-acetyltransferase [Oceanobacillus kapialis]|uniref:GNAT family N-acetyltransferase n=1 Tax=Oceanobacillus kapialis TaxID=481353 RepID=UPI00384B031C
MNIEITNIPVLETKHYLLRGIKEEDAKTLLLFMGDKKTMQYITPHPVRTESEMREEIAKYLERFAEKKEIPWVILNKETKEIVGQFRFHKLDLWHRKTEIGAIIREEYQKKGFYVKCGGGLNQPITFFISCCQRIFFFNLSKPLIP